MKKVFYSLFFLSTLTFCEDAQAGFVKKAFKTVVKAVKNPLKTLKSVGKTFIKAVNPLNTFKAIAHGNFGAVIGLTPIGMLSKVTHGFGPLGKIIRPVAQMGGQALGTALGSEFGPAGSFIGGALGGQMAGELFNPGGQNGGFSDFIPGGGALKGIGKLGALKGIGKLASVAGGGKIIASVATSFKL